MNIKIIGIRFAVITESIDAPKCYAELKPSELFHSYRIESAANNQIMMEINLSSLSQALTSAKNSEADTIQIKLTKKEGKSNLAIAGRGKQLLSYDILHYISIVLLQPDSINHFLPPNVPPPEVALQLPPGKFMRTIIDRMGKLSKTMTLIAYQSGRLVLSVNQDLVNIKTYFTGLEAEWGMLDREQNLTNSAKIILDVRKFSNVLRITFAQSYDKVTLYVTDNSILVVHLILKPDVGAITIYVPVVTRPDDDDDEGEGEN